MHVGEIGIMKIKESDFFLVDQDKLQSRLEQRLRRIRDASLEYKDNPLLLKRIFFDYLRNVTQKEYDTIEKAFDLAYKYHKNGKKNIRDSGHPYIVHCLESALIADEVHADATTLAGAIAHDILENNGNREKEIYEELVKSFGDYFADSIIIPLTPNKNIKDVLERKRATNQAVMTVAEKDFDRKIYRIRVSDRISNLLTLEHLKPKQYTTAEERASRILADTTRYILPFADVIDKINKDNLHPPFILLKPYVEKIMGDYNSKMAEKFQMSA